MSAPPLTITVWDKHFVRQGFLGAPQSVDLLVRHNLPGSAKLDVPLNDPILPALITEGAAVTIEYDGMAAQLFSGPVSLADVSYATNTATFTVNDDFDLINRVLAWPVPSANLAGQNLATFDLAGPAETVAKTVIAANVQRLGLPVQVAPDQGRGQVIAASWRMHPIADKLLPLLDAGGIGITIRQAPAVPLSTGGVQSPGLIVDVYEPRNYPRLLSDEAGTIIDWHYVKTIFKGSRWVLGSQTAPDPSQVGRVWAQDIDDIAESHWGPRTVSEVFIDSGTIGSGIVTAQQATDSARQSLVAAQIAFVDRSALDSALTGLRAAQVAFAADPSATNQSALTSAQTTYNTAIQDVLARQATLEYAKGVFDSAIAATVTAVATSDAEVTNAFQTARLTQGASVGLSVTLAETGVFRYGDDLRVGDRVRMKVAVGAEVQDVLLEAHFTWTTGSAAAGLRVVPVVGDVPTPTRDLARLIGALYRAQRDQATRR